MDTKAGSFILWLILETVILVTGDNKSLCPRPEAILPCICTNRSEDVQIWCTHSDLEQVTKGIQKIGDYVRTPIDELIIENNYLPSLPGKIFQNVKILRLMLRHNGLERLSVTWLETQEMNLVEIFLVEHDLSSLPAESFMKLQNLQAITIQSRNLKRIPSFIKLPKLKYISIQAGSLNTINEHTFDSLPNLDRLYIQGSSNLQTIKENAFYNLPKLRVLEVTACGVHHLHLRALSLLPNLKELSFAKNRFFDAAMVGRATRDLPMLTVLNLSYNDIDKLSEGAFVDQPMLEKIFLSNNKINVIHHGAFHRVPKLRVVELNYNNINRIHPESFLQPSGSGVEELTLIGNHITHISEFRALLDALPRLKFIDMSENLLQELPRGALRGHPSLERLHLNKNRIKFIQAEAFIAMPALRELHLCNNSLSDFIEGPFWNLPALKGLDLSHNYFKRLQPKLLYNLPALRRINLSHNQLNIIDPITFMESPLLEYVNISGNALVSIHPATFRNLPKLYEIDASHNRLVEFVPGLPRGLEHLYLQRNQINGLPSPPSPDMDLPSLRSLDISNNGIQKIPQGSLKSLHNLRKLLMKRNGLRQIEASTFSDLRNLEQLDLGDNQIMSVHPKCFANLTKLKKVNLHGNTIENFDFAAIQENAALSTIDFSKNNLRSINPNLVKKAVDVEILNVSSNHLHELPASLNMLPKLKILDASFNNIRQFDGNCINNVHTLTEVKMPNNKIIELRSGSFEELRDLTTINLDSNQIEILHTKAISNLPNLVSIYLARNHIIDIPDRVFSNLPKLRIIELQGNRLQFISLRAFENVPLVQYLNLSSNQLANLDSSGLRQLPSLEVLDLSYNRLSKISRTSFQNMEWLVELNLDHNKLCHIGGQPFDFMPRLKVLSLRHNRLTSVSEASFSKLRNNIAILDIDGNPLVCNCQILWLKSWLSEATSIGPKCADGTYVKRMAFSNADCQNVQVFDDDAKTCGTHESEVLLPGLATSQVFSSLDKIKDFAAQIKNNYQVNNLNKISHRPSPEESEYFYDEYVDYPYNDTLADNMNPNMPIQNAGAPMTTQHGSMIINTEVKNSSSKVTAVSSAPNSGFTFFGMPIPPIDVGKIWNTGRKIDSTDSKNTNNYVQQDIPKFETGGFSPVLPTTAGGFVPMTKPPVNHTTDKIFAQGSSKNTDLFGANIVTTTQPTRNVHSNSTHKKTKTEIHELEAFLDNDNSTHVAYNRTKNVEEENADQKKLSKYNMMESNVTITQVTEKEGLLITTDTTNDMSLQGWLETSSASYSLTSPVTSKPLIKKHIDENKPTALSAILIPDSEDVIPKRNHSARPATITKVVAPQLEKYDLQDMYSPVINREGKTRFPNENSDSNLRTKNFAEGKEWYYQNYNKTNIDTYIAPAVAQSSNSIIISVNVNLLFTLTVFSIFNYQKCKLVH